MQSLEVYATLIRDFYKWQMLVEEGGFDTPNLMPSILYLPQIQKFGYFVARNTYCVSMGRLISLLIRDLDSIHLRNHVVVIVTELRLLYKDQIILIFQARILTVIYKNLKLLLFDLDTKVLVC